ATVSSSYPPPSGSFPDITHPSATGIPPDLYAFHRYTWTKTDAQVRKRGEQTGLDTLVVDIVYGVDYQGI
ncbi:hypothetical protein, partial [Mycobacterium tuberculosis]|uniref:hypothetical protein n=1 Tax=Mycobacterium tuberculosis TaxID=1773 RepID=UPI00254CC78B